MIALITFVTGTLQYVVQGRQQRANQFIEMRRRFLENVVFRDLLSLLAKDSLDLKHASIQDRRNLVGFLEEVALLVDSKIIREDVAYYMFGYYVNLIYKSENFWEGLDREGPYWQVFRKFAERMKDHQPRLGIEGRSAQF